MDDGRLLWSLDVDDVRPYAHLEYQDGIATWDRFGNAIEVWKADDEQRGVFRQTAVLQHDCETRGFQHSFDNLCVVSSEGHGFIYDMTQTPPTLLKRPTIESDAVGHLYQNQDVVVYSMGAKGYHAHSKETGELLGVLQPNTGTHIYHIRHPAPAPPASITTARHGATDKVCPPEHPSRGRLLPLRVDHGSHPDIPSPYSLDNDEWGAGMINDNFMVGVSRGGRVYMCSDWRAALSSPEQAAATSAIIECESDGSTFDLGGWLSIRNDRIMFEINDRIYILMLNLDGPLPRAGRESLPVWATSSSSAPQLTVPVSFMAIYDDCIMTTYTTLGRVPQNPEAPRNVPVGMHRPRAFPTKAIRVISLAPDLQGNDLLLQDTDDWQAASAGRPECNTSDERSALQAGILQLVSLLGNDSDEDDEED
ncbi:hypothetical protein AAFC00_006099 [Neodothiora populina]